MALAAATGGELRIRNAEPDDLITIRRPFRRLGLQTMIEGKDVLVPPEQKLEIRDDLGDAIPKIDDGPWPAFPADLTSIALALATQASGTILIFEKMFENRMFFVDKLVAMGARITLCDPHRAIVSGPSRLHGERLSSPDIRAGMAMLIAALAADGRSEIDNIREIDRGYEQHRRPSPRARRPHRARRAVDVQVPSSRRGRSDDTPDPAGDAGHPSRRDARAAPAQPGADRAFERFGYGEVATPTIEYDEVLARGESERGAPVAYRFFDESGELLAMRSDMTIPIARLVANRFSSPSRRFGSVTWRGPTARCALSAARCASSPRSGWSFGVPAPQGTVEVIEVLAAALDAAGLAAP